MFIVDGASFAFVDVVREGVADEVESTQSVGTIGIGQAVGDIGVIQCSGEGRGEVATVGIKVASAVFERGEAGDVGVLVILPFLIVQTGLVVTVQVILRC